MRKTINPQPNLREPWLELEHARELETISSLLDAHPKLNELVLQDLRSVTPPAGSDVGRGGMSAEQVLRALLVKQLNQFTYRELAFHLADSRSYRTFCQLSIIEPTPSKSTLAANIKAVKFETLEQINRELVVIDEERVPAEEKVVSIFEEHTDIIRKDRRETLYGHKVCMTGGSSSMILDCVILDGNPSDSTLAETMIDRQVELYERAPRQVAYDGAFSSKANLEAIKGKGVEDVAFTKAHFAVTDMVKSSWVYQRLRRFRCGIEGVISFLKRVFGLDRCTWRSLPSFKSYVWSSIITCNLLMMARHLLR